jgi:hypothetical protein
MRFVIEIARAVDEDTYEVLYRSSFDAISPSSAKSAAQSLLESHDARGANSVKIRDVNGEELYSWRSNDDRLDHR